MLRQILASCFVLVAAAGCSALPQRTARITGGTVAADGEFPFQVAVIFNNTVLMGSATILSPNWAMTVGHKIDFPYPYNNSMFVLSGTQNLASGGNMHTVERIVLHPGYQPNGSFPDDFGLIRVSPPFAIDGVTTDVAKLPQQDEVIPDGSVVTVNGWGQLEDQGPFPQDVLHRVDLYTLNLEECRAFYAPYNVTVFDTNICAGDPDAIKGDCLGDGGSSVTYNGVVVGLVDRGMGCGTNPSIYTRIASYVNWINENLD